MLPSTKIITLDDTYSCYAAHSAHSTPVTSWQRLTEISWSGYTFLSRKTMGFITWKHKRCVAMAAIEVESINLPRTQVYLRH